MRFPATASVSNVIPGVHRDARGAEIRVHVFESPAVFVDAMREEQDGFRGSFRDPRLVFFFFFFPGQQRSEQNRIKMVGGDAMDVSGFRVTGLVHVTKTMARDGSWGSLKR